jgi:multiple sugar transport system permease protein
VRDLVTPGSASPPPTTARPRRRLRRTALQWRDAAAFIGPTLIALALVAVVPTLWAMYSSLYDWHFHRSAARTFIGFGNYLRLGQDPRFLNAVWVTVVYTTVSVAATMVFGTFLALLTQAPFPGKAAARALLTIPMIMTPVVSTLVWKTFFFDADLGLVNWVLGFAGIAGPAWVASSPSALIAILVVNVWFMTPFVFLVMDAALEGLPAEVIDAAKIDGANYAQRVRHVVLPMLRATIVFTVIFRITIDARMFEIIHVMTGGGPARDTEVLTLWVYNAALRNFHLGYGNAGGIVLMILVGAACLAIMLLGLRDLYRRTGST